MSQNTNYSVPLRQKALLVRRPPSGRNTRQTGRVAKSSSNPASPNPTQLRRRAPLPVGATSASGNYITPFAASSLAPNVHCAPLPPRGPQQRPMSWHPVGSDSESWDAYNTLWSQTYPVASTASQEDSVPVGYDRQSGHQPGLDWRNVSQSEGRLSPVLPDPSNPGFFGSTGFEVPSILHFYPQPQPFHGMQHYSTPAFAKLSFDPLFQQQEVSHPRSRYQSQAGTMHCPPAVSDTFDSIVVLPETLRPDPWYLPDAAPLSKNTGCDFANKELVGMGLYDEPENMSSYDPQSDQYQSILFGGGGKGWKLEETFHPKGEELEAERDCQSSVGDGDHRSPLPDLDFEDFNPIMSDELEPLPDFASSFDYGPEAAMFPWATGDAQPGFVSALNCYPGMYPFAQYPDV